MTSVNNLEVAEPMDDATETTVETTEVTTSGDVASTELSETQGTENVQSAEENAKYAAARRRAEQEFAERQRLEDLEYERRFGDYENPITHQPIRSKKDYFDALDAQEKLQRDAELESKGIDPKLFEDMVNKQVANNPAVLQANAIMQETQQNMIKARLEEDVKAISQLDSSVKNIDDILNAPNASQIIGLVQANNMSLVDAYKIANFDVLMANKTNATKQAAINNMKGTQHLSTTDGVTGGDDGGVDIPSDELAFWKRAFPDASMKELRAKYNRTI